MMYDIIIIGAGPAGLTAGLYALRAGLDILLLEASMHGGQIINAPKVDNYPGMKGAAGWELAQSFYAQVKEAGAEIRYEAALSIEKSDESWVVSTNESSYMTKTIIIANGTKRKKIGCAGEEKFSGRGISWCATCDGSFYKDKTVAVVGGGNTALEDALYLANLADKVYILNRKDKFTAEENLISSVMKKDNIISLFFAVPEEIYGETKVKGIKYKDLKTNESRNIDVDGIFVALGLQRDNAVFSNVVKLDEGGRIVAGEDCRTSSDGIFAAGDTRTKQLRQIVTATADGAIAATGALEYIRSKKQ